MTLSLIAESQARRLLIPVFIVFALTRPVIEPGSSASAADGPFARPQIGYNACQNFNS